MGKSNPVILEQVRTALPKFPSKLRPGVPSALEAICLKCLEKSPARRYPSAQALADDLGRWLDDERPKEIPGPLVRLAKRVRRPVAAAAMVPLLFLLGTGFYNLYASERAAKWNERELAQGRAVTLIQETGKPRWYRWRTGKSTSQAALASDGSFLVSTWSPSLLELVPDTQTDRYRITAQVRHEDSVTGPTQAFGVGLFVACNNYHSGTTPYLFFTELVFNGARGKADVYKLFPQGTFSKPPGDNIVELCHELLFNADAPHQYVRMFNGAHGPRFRPMGPEFWHTIELVVTPEGITAQWNGQTFSITAAEIRKGLADEMQLVGPLAADLGLPPGFVPEFRPRGGVGLVIQKGSASFRSVRITPL
jgi:serine/threonine-protein kinase